ncbi:MAG: DUF5723 family protein [Bacteroidia bacterium]
MQLFKRSAFILFIFSSAIKVNAQGDFTLYAMRELNQSVSLNPAFMPDYNLSIGVPLLSGIMVGSEVHGLNINTILSSLTPDKNIDLGVLSSKLDGKFFGVKPFFQTELFHLRLGYGHYQFSVFSGLKVNSNVLLSNTFIELVGNGNANYMGQNMVFGGNNIQVSSYIETGIGVSREFERWTIGTRLKWLSGIANLSTDNLNMNWYTSAASFDKTTFSFGGTIRSSGLPSISDSLNGSHNADNLVDSNSGNNLSNDLKSVGFFSNQGFAIDFGATFRVTPLLNVHASVLDLGGITWNNHTYNYNLDQINLEHSGFTINQFKDTTQNKLMQDSLNNLLTRQIKRANTTFGSYYTPLVTRVLIGADYDLTLRDRVGVLMQFQYFNNEIFPAYFINYNRKVGTNWNMTASYGYYNSSMMNLGFGTSVKIGAFQVYIVHDDILFYFFPQYARNIYLRFGFNLVWGQPRPRARY